MSTVQKIVFTVVSVMAIAAVSAISEAKEVCYTDKDGKTHCFNYECLKPIENKLTPIVCSDAIAPKPSQGLAARRAVILTSRAEILKGLRDDCIKAGGSLEDKGSKVVCTLRTLSTKPERPSIR